MRRITRWLAGVISVGRRAPGGKPGLGLEPLEPRTTPATLLTPGLPSGSPANADTSDQLLGISGDGNYMLFASKATNLVAGVTDNNNNYDLFWRDLKAGTTKLVTAQAGTLNALGFGTGSTPVPIALQAVLSYDGQYVAFVSAAPASAVTGDPTVQDQISTNDVFEWQASTGAAKLVSIRFGQNSAVGNQAGVEATDPNISDDGRYVSYGTALDGGQIDTSVALDNGNNSYDLFIRDMTAADPTKGTTAATRVPGKADLVGKFGTVDRPVGRYMSGDGRYVVYSTTVGADIIEGLTDSANTSDVFIRDMNNTGLTGGAVISLAVNGVPVGAQSDQFAQAPIISRSGNAVVFVAKADGGSDSKQLVTGYTLNGSPTDLYERQTPFASGAATLLMSAVNGTTGLGANAFIEQPTPGTPASYQVTADGKVVVFDSAATNLVDPSKDRNGIGLDVFVRDTSANTTEVASVGGDGRTGSTPSSSPSVSDDGRYVTFVSAAPELGTGVTDSNGTSDAFLRDRVTATTRTLSTSPAGGTAGNDATTAARVAANGSMTAFVSKATNLTTAATSTASGTANLYEATLPLPPVLGGAMKVLLASGTADGKVLTYSVGTGGQLTASGSAVIPFPGFSARIAVGDVNGDGTPDTVAVVGPGGGSLLRVIDGSTGKDLVPATTTFESSFTGGLFVTAADLDGDGKAEIILSPDVGGGGRVQIFSYSGTGLTLKANFFGIDDPSFRGGARVAAGDVNGDGKPDVIVGAGFGGGPRVAVFDGASIFSPTTSGAPPKLINDFFAFPGSDATSLRNGVYVAAGDVNGDGKADLIFGGGPGGGPRVFALDGAQLAANQVNAAYGSPLANFFAFDSTQRGGVRLTVKDLDGDAKADIVVASGEQLPSQIKTYLSANLPAGGTGSPSAFQVVDPFNTSTVPGGVFVG